MNINLNNGQVNITTFSVSSTNLSSFNVDWGDGTYSETFPHSHVYSKVGNYDVKILGCSALSSVVYSENVWVNNLIEPKVEITTNPLSSLVGCGDTFEVCVSSLEENMTLHFYSSGSNSVPYSDETFWSHLNPTWKFTDDLDNVILTKTIKGDPIFNSNETIAYSGCFTFNYIDDMPNNPVLFVTLETPDNSRVYAAVPHSVSAVAPNSICITEDGIRPIYGIQWAGIPIPYVISFCDTNSDCSTILHYTSGEILSANLDSKCVFLDQSISTYSIELFDENCFNTGGYLLTSVTIPTTDVPSISTIDITDKCDFTGEIITQTIRKPAYDATIKVTARVFDGNSTYTLTGESNPFKIYPFEEYNKFRRHGESENISDQLNHYAFTDRMRNHPVLWSYMDALLGDGLDSIGTKAYFSIDRFADQHADLDRCNIASLIDKSVKLDVNMDDYALEYPTDIRRIMDMVSMPLEKIVGTRCVCNTNFVNCENCCGQNVCGLCGFDKRSNIGDQLVSSDFVSAGQSILYKEGSGDVYEILNVMPQDGEDVFKLNTLSAECINEKDDICFYKWDTTKQNHPIESEIDYKSEFTTIDPSLSSDEDWYGDEGVIEEVLNYLIIKGLELDQ